jgi:hypothetical protein
MNDEKLRQGLDQLRSALSIIDADATLGELPPQSLQDLKVAVDSVRQILWSAAVAQHTGDYEAFLGRVRVRRATETCQELMSDLDTGTVTGNTPGLEVVHAALRQLAGAFKTANL